MQKQLMTIILFVTFLPLIAFGGREVTADTFRSSNGLLQWTLPTGSPGVLAGAASPNFTGPVTAPDGFVGDLTGVAAQCTRFATVPSGCAPGSASRGIDDKGNSVCAQVVNQISASSPMNVGSGSNPNITIDRASSTTDGYLDHADFNRFNVASVGAVWGFITGTLSDQTDLQAALDAKEPLITVGTTLQYYRGDKTFQTLNTSVVPEGSNLYFTNARFDTRFDTDFATKSTTDLAEGSRLYYTNARGIGSVLTGYISGAGTVVSTDSVLQAIQKLNGNIAAIVDTGITELTGDVTAGPGSGVQAATIANNAVTNSKIANSTIDLAAKVTGVLPYANGGTNAATSWAQGGIFFGGASAFAQDTSNFFWNGTTHRLGIGTATPRGGLDIINTNDAFFESPQIAGAGGSDNNTWLMYASSTGFFGIFNRNQLLTQFALNSQGRVVLGNGGFGHPDATVVTRNQTGITTIPTMAIVAIGSQTADLQQWTDSSEVEIAKLDINGKGWFAGVDARSNKITNVTDPASAQDAATKAYVDATVKTDAQETPSGTVNSVNVTFVLAHTPVAAAGVALFQDGAILVQGTDYTISGATITMAMAPLFGQTLYATYRF